MFSRVLTRGARYLYRRSDRFSHVNHGVSRNRRDRIKDRIHNKSIQMIRSLYEFVDGHTARLTAEIRTRSATQAVILAASQDFPSPAVLASQWCRRRM